MRPEAPALTHSPSTRRTLAEAVVELARLKAHIERIDHELADYWQHSLAVLIMAQLQRGLTIGRLCWLSGKSRMSVKMPTIAAAPT